MASVNSTSGSTPPEPGELGAYVQFGCGICAPTTWLNFDAGPAFWIERKLPFLKPALIKRGFPDYPANIRYGNGITGLPVRRESARAVYCSHVLEHLALKNGFDRLFEMCILTWCRAVRSAPCSRILNGSRILIYPLQIARRPAASCATRIWEYLNRRAAWPAFSNCCLDAAPICGCGTSRTWPGSLKRPVSLIFCAPNVAIIRNQGFTMSRNLAVGRIVSA